MKLIILDQIQRVWGHLLTKRKRQLAILGLVMVLASFAELASLGAVLPFLGIITNPEVVFHHSLVRPLIDFAHLQGPIDLLLPATIFFCVATILAGFIRLLLIWFQTHLAMAIGVDFSIDVYERTLHQPYCLHVLQNSSDILAGIGKAGGLVNFIIQPVLNLIGSSVILITVLAALVAISPAIALSTLCGFGLIYLIVVRLTRLSIARNSKTIASHQAKVTKAVQEGLGGIRDVLLDGTQSVYSKLYRDAVIPLQAAHASNQVVAGSPRFGIEALGIVLIALVTYVSVVVGGSMHSILPVLGALALGAQRLLPLLQQIYSSYITIKGSQASINDALALLDQPFPTTRGHQSRYQNLVFNNSIKLENLSFRYKLESALVLKKINLEIPKGSRVGFIGITGSGKSTLLDVVMGLLNPNDGRILVDGCEINEQNIYSWQAHISHVPQTIFLSDTSITENIAFGVPSEKIDMRRVHQAAEQAQIGKTIESWPEGYETLVGERGVRLSGGQRQRIGIARAFYKCADVIVLDEATSALDNETETSVMQAIESLGRDLTILIVAHRITTLKQCDFIVELKEGVLKYIGNYEQITRRTVS